MSDRKPIDTAALTAPVRAVLIDGALYELLEEKSWAGAWAYPPAWDKTSQETWAAIQGRKIHEDGLRAAAEEQQRAASSSPESMLARARIEADEAQRAREAAERRREGEAAWLKALEEHGGRLRRLPTTEGDVIIMLAMTRAEGDAANARAARLREVALEHDPKNKLKAINDWNGAQRDAMLAKVIHPARDRVKALGEKYADLWPELEAMRDDLVRVRQVDEGKGPAL